jgi:glucan 1,3-beta-glucosidase
VLRNVKDYGAVGDGNADDSDAINRAIQFGERCGQGCASSSTSGAVVYFPPGTYKISKPLIQYYFTSFVGDPDNRPVIKGSNDFTGFALMSTDQYGAQGSW